MFGKPLLQNGSPVPLLVQSCIRFLAQHGLQSRGLFEVIPSSASLSGLVAELTRIGEEASSTTQQTKLSALFSPPSPSSPDSEWLIPGNPPFTVAGLLRYYLEHLPEPLIHSSVYHRVVAVGSSLASSPPASDDQAVLALNELGMVLRIALPFAHLKTLQILLLLLAKVAAAKKDTQMDETALAVALGPAILRPTAAAIPDSALDAGYLEDLPAIVAAVALLIRHARDPGLFDVPSPPSDPPASSTAPPSGPPPPPSSSSGGADAELEEKRRRAKARALAAFAAAEQSGAVEMALPSPIDMSASQTRVFETWRSERDARYAAEADMARPTAVKQFGLSLDVLGRRNVALGVDPIPLPLRVCFDFLETGKELTSTPDLFVHDLFHVRASIESAIAVLDESKGPQWSVEETDPHVAAGVVIHFFRCLPEPLIPDSSHKLLTISLNALVTSASTTDVPDTPSATLLDAEAIRSIRSVVTNLPPMHLSVLEYMIGKFRVFLAAQDTHGVSLEALAHVFGPLWFQGPPSSSDASFRTPAFALHSHTLFKTIYLLSSYILFAASTPPPEAPATPAYAVPLTTLHASISSHLQQIRDAMAR